MAAKYSNSELRLGKRERDSAGNIIIGGRNSAIIAKSPKPESIEGSTLVGLVVDEIGKTKDLKTLLDLTLPALNDAEGFDREGFVFLCGTAGDLDQFPDAKMIWDSSEEYDLVKYFSPGWYGRNCDKYGNEDIEKNVREILEKRHKVWNNRKLSLNEKGKADHYSNAAIPIDCRGVFSI